MRCFLELVEVPAETAKNELRDLQKSPRFGRDPDYAGSVVHTVSTGTDALLTTAFAVLPRNPAAPAIPPETSLSEGTLRLRFTVASF